MLSAGCGAAEDASPRAGTVVASGNAAARLQTNELALYRMTADGSDLVRLSPPDARDSAPAWSPDGGQIVFQRDTLQGPGLYLMDRDGLRTKMLWKLEIGFASPAWSPDGKLVAYSDPPRGIRVLDVRTKRLRRISKASDDHPSWSPDGRQIAFSHDRTGWGDLSIWIMSSDGKNRRQLTRPGKDKDLSPAWSPDGTLIAFERRSLGGFETWVVDVESGTERRVGDGTDPTWSRDGRALLVSRLDGLYVLSLDGDSGERIVEGFWAESSWTTANP